MSSCSDCSATNAAQSEQIQILVLAKQLQAMRTSGEALVKMLQDIAQGKAPGKGDSLDVSG